MEEYLPSLIYILGIDYRVNYIFYNNKCFFKNVSIFLSIYWNYFKLNYMCYKNIFINDKKIYRSIHMHFKYTSLSSCIAVQCHDQKIQSRTLGPWCQPRSQGWSYFLNNYYFFNNNTRTWCYIHMLCLSIWRSLFRTFILCF